MDELALELEKKTVELLDFYIQHDEIKPHPLIKALLLAFVGCQNKSEGESVGVEPPYAVVLRKTKDGPIVMLRVLSGTTTLTEQAVNSVLESEISKIRRSF